MVLEMGISRHGLGFAHATPARCHSFAIGAENRQRQQTAASPMKFGKLRPAGDEFQKNSSVQSKPDAFELPPIEILKAYVDRQGFVTVKLRITGPPPFERMPLKADEITAARNQTQLLESFKLVGSPAGHKTHSVTIHGTGRHVSCDQASSTETMTPAMIGAVETILDKAANLETGSRSILLQGLKAMREKQADSLQNHGQPHPDAISGIALEHERAAPELVDA